MGCKKRYFLSDKGVGGGGDLLLRALVVLIMMPVAGAIIRVPVLVVVARMAARLALRRAATGRRCRRWIGHLNLGVRGIVVGRGRGRRRWVRRRRRGGGLRGRVLLGRIGCGCAGGQSLRRRRRVAYGVGRVYKNVVLGPVKEVVQIQVERWCIGTLEHGVALRLIPVERLLSTVRAIRIIPREIVALFWAATMWSRWLVKIMNMTKKGPLRQLRTDEELGEPRVSLSKQRS